MFSAMHRPVATGLACALLLGITATSAGCGGATETSSGAEGNAERSLNLVLDSPPNGTHIGLYMADEVGAYREEGLKVEIRPPADPSASIRLVSKGDADLGVARGPEAIRAEAAGLDVVPIGVLIKGPDTSLLWLGNSSLRTPSDLEGRTVATAGLPYQEAFLDTILAQAGLRRRDVKRLDAGFHLASALVSGEADAMVGGFKSVEGAALRDRGKQPVALPVSRFGVPPYDELVLVANPQKLQAEPETFRDFMSALELGTIEAFERPQSATKVLTEVNEGREPELMAAEVNATVPLLIERGPYEPFAYMVPEEWVVFARWMKKHSLIRSLPDRDRLFTNEYLASEGNIPEPWRHKHNAPE